jgi:hypothetical protein
LGIPENLGNVKQGSTIPLSKSIKNPLKKGKTATAPSGLSHPHLSKSREKRQPLTQIRERETENGEGGERRKKGAKTRERAPAPDSL